MIRGRSLKQPLRLLRGATQHCGGRDPTRWHRGCISPSPNTEWPVPPLPKHSLWKGFFRSGKRLEWAEPCKCLSLRQCLYKLARRFSFSQSNHPRRQLASDGVRLIRHPLRPVLQTCSDLRFHHTPALNIKYPPSTTSNSCHSPPTDASKPLDNSFVVPPVIKLSSSRSPKHYVGSNV